MPLLLWIILCAALGGIASAVFAVALLWVPERHGARLLPHFLSFATGALLGAAFLALLPEAIAGAGTAGAHGLGVALVSGLGVFFVIEKLVLWWHTEGEEDGRLPVHLRTTRMATGTPMAGTAPPASSCCAATACTTPSMAC